MTEPEIKNCQLCGERMVITVRNERSPIKMWECTDGHTEPLYGQYGQGGIDEGEA